MANSIIKQLCKKYTDLGDADIAIIETMSRFLQTVADLEDADIFIDCPGRDGDAIVVAEAKPSSVPSSYKKTVVGLLAKQENEPAVARTFRLGVSTKEMKAITQENGMTIQTVEAIRNGSKIIGVLIQEKRLDEQRELSERIHFSQQSDERIAIALTHMASEGNWLTECIDEAIIMVNHEGIVTFRNTLARELYQTLGYVDDVLGQPYENIRLIEEAGEKVRETDGYTLKKATVSGRVLNIRRIPLKASDVEFAIIIRDETWRWEQEQALILKSVAIKEMHHRVKNNLQTIASLLRLQMRRTKNEETKEVLGESMNRILSIASTHEVLSQSGVDEVMLGAVINNIRNYTLRYFENPLCADIVIEGDDFAVDSDIATSIAMVVNELLQNSFKYAFNDREGDGDKGLVRINVTHGDLYSKIQVVDNGSGFDVDAIDMSSLGLSIVQTLVKDKLKGNLEMESDKNGTSAVFTFRNKLM